MTLIPADSPDFAAGDSPPPLRGRDRVGGGWPAGPAKQDVIERRTPLAPLLDPPPRGGRTGSASAGEM